MLPSKISRFGLRQLLMCLGDGDPRMHCNVKELIILAQVVPLIYLVLLYGSIEGSLVWNRAIETHRATMAFSFLCLFISLQCPLLQSFSLFSWALSF